MAIHIGRREFITTLASAAAAWPLAARAQQPAKLPTIGFLGQSTRSATSEWVAAFVQRLRELGWIENRTVAIVYRWVEGREDRFTEVTDEFVRLKVDVIVTSGTPEVLAAKQATSVIPIVFATAGDPVGNGLVASLARSWLMSVILSPYWSWARLRRRPARSVSKSIHSKSGAPRISRPFSRRSRAARMHFMFVLTGS